MTTIFQQTANPTEQIYLSGQDLVYDRYDEAHQSQHGARYYRVMGVLSLVLAAFSITVIPGILALILGHSVLAATVADSDRRTEVTRGYAFAGLVVTYAVFVTGFFLVVLPRLFA